MTYSTFYASYMIKPVIRLLILAGIMLMFLSVSVDGYAQTSKAPSPEEANKKAYLEIMKAFETGETGELGKYVSEKMISHNDPPPGITSTGLQYLKDAIAMTRTAFPELKMKLHHMAVDADVVIAHGTWTGSNTGPLMGMDPTGRVVNTEFVDVIRFANGKAAEHWQISDGLSLLVQLGTIPRWETAPVPFKHATYDLAIARPVDAAKEEEMKKSYRAVVKMIESGNLSSLSKFLTADFKENISIPNTELPAGIEGAKEAMTSWKETYPDLKITINNIAVEGDILMAHITTEGTFAGAEGTPETAKGKVVKLETVDIVQFNSAGKAIAHWAISDTYKKLVQLGVIGEPKSTEPEAK